MSSSIDIKSLAIKYGSYYAFLYILILVIEESFNFDNQVVIGIGGVVLSFLLVWQATNEFKNTGNGLIELSSAIKIGLAIGAIGGLIYALFLYVNYSFINTDFIDNAREAIQEQIQLQKDIGDLKTDEEAEIAEKAAMLFTSPFVLATMALIGQLVKALVFGLIIGLINRNKNQ